MDVHVPKWLQSQTLLYTGKQEIVEQCLKDYQAYDPLSTAYSDHKIVVTKLRLRFLANGKTIAKRTSFDWHCFSTSHSVREAYIVEVKILNRIRPRLEPLLRTNKNWFQPGRSTVGQILTLRRFVEGIKAKNLTAVLTVVDFKF